MPLPPDSSATFQWDRTVHLATCQAQIKQGKNDMCVDDSAFSATEAENCILPHLRPYKKSKYYFYTCEQEHYYSVKLILPPPQCFCLHLWFNQDKNGLSSIFFFNSENYQGKKLLHRWQRRIFQKSFLAQRIFLKQ